jgi:hypothetical protein
MADEAEAAEIERTRGIPRQTTMVYNAISSNDTERVRSLLSETGDRRVDLNLPTQIGLAPLSAAVLKNNIPIVKLLLEKGADVNKRTNSRVSPLMFAVSVGELDMIKLLIAHGADINARTANGFNLLHIAVTSTAADRIVPFVLSLKPEFATEVDNAGRVPDMTGVRIAGVDPAIAALSAERRSAAVIAYALRVKQARERAAAHAARDAGFERDIEEYYIPLGRKKGGRHKAAKAGRKTVKARKARNRKTRRR